MMSLRPDTTAKSRKPHPALFAPRRARLAASAVALLGAVLGVTTLLEHPVHADTAPAASDPAALKIVQAAVQAELAADKTDHSIWMYRDRDSAPGKRALYETVETPQGSLRRLVELNGHPLSPDAAEAEQRRIARFIDDRSAQAKAHRDAEHDDQQARAMLQMLPKAFLWTITNQTPEATTLRFEPNPGFHPPDMQARVMGMMAGTMVVTHEGDRIRSLKGALTQDVTFGYGLFGRLHRGGTFDVERREISAPNARPEWQITESHVHIGGKALLFKTIGQQEEEVKSDWKPSPAQTLESAAGAGGEVLMLACHASRDRKRRRRAFRVLFSHPE
jgi:hypothetical protein